MITDTESNVLAVMAEKDRDWTWMILDRVLSMKNVPGFGNVVNIINALANEGLVDIVDSGHPSMPFYRVTDKGHEYIKNKSSSVDAR